MPIEKDKPMSPQAIRTFTTKGEELSRTLKEAKIQPEDKITITIEAVVEDTPVTDEQQRLLDMVDNITPIKVEGDIAEFVAKEREHIDGRNLKDKK